MGNIFGPNSMVTMQSICGLCILMSWQGYSFRIAGFFDGNPPVIGGFLCQRDDIEELYCFLCCYVKQLAEKPFRCCLFQTPSQSCDGNCLISRKLCSPLLYRCYILYTQFCFAVLWFSIQEQETCTYWQHLCRNGHQERGLRRGTHNE